MPIKPNIRSGAVDWTGENPGMLFKKNGQEEWCTLMLFFRVAWSPAGAGNMLMLLEDPYLNNVSSDNYNLIMADNEALRDYIQSGFIEKLGTFCEPPGYSAAQYFKIENVVSDGDPMGDFYSEYIEGGGFKIKLVWKDFSQHTALELPQELTGTGEHTMYSLLVDAKSAFIEVNGRRSEGFPVAREQAGLKLSTSFLYFSETWIFPDI